MAKINSFTNKLSRLEKIVETLEDEELDLEEGMKLLEEGLRIHKDCQKQLKSAQTKIDNIISSKEVN